ncbi:MAG: S8 family serine peptidase [Candidatus Bipolaricaulota bacterium]|nr:S8 family serine peptidase [Candidatus Bipolaricaulota bacterium]MDW8126506.1 S8 family peptidase [Candidatus Bipolaricaulota bacterium]
MKLLTFLVLTTLLAFAGPEKLDPLLRTLLYPSPEAKVAALALYPEDAADAKIPVFLELNQSGASTKVPGLRSLLGTLATATMSLSQIERVAEMAEVRHIWASRPVEPLLDRSVPEIGAPVLWYGAQSSTGQGVIIGIVDSGVDILHPAFRMDQDADGFLEKTRIVFYWDQSAAGSGWFPPFWGDESGEAAYGRVYTQRDLEAAISGNYSPVPDVMGHGTHVAAIAAGGPSLGLPGVAPGAELVVVKTNFYEDSVVDGIKFVFEVAEYLGKPAVVNISLGGHAGPHDGTGPFERMVSTLVDRPGRIVVAAAGNEGGKKIHVGGDIRTRTTWTIVPAASSVVVRFWYTFPAQFRVNITSPLGETLLVTPGQARGLTSAAGSLWLDNGVDALNQTQQIFLSLVRAAPGSAWWITFEPIFGGRIDGWIESSSMGEFLEGDGNMSIAEPGNAERVITVGAYVTKTSWASQAGVYKAEGYELQALAPFSSRGPTRDGRLKPDLAAPGAWIASARSRDAQVSPWYALPDGWHMVLAGTSMAAPHVAGACALLLSLRPNLSWQEALTALQSGARVDSFVGPVPNLSWGKGKLDVPKAWAALGTPAPVSKPWLAGLGNPVSSGAFFRYQLPQGVKWAELRVYDLLGRLVWQESLEPGGGTVRWDLRSRSGAQVASGLYLAVLVTDQGASDPIRVVVSR